MADLVGGAAVDEVCEEAVAVGGHGHEFAAALGDPFHDFIGGLAEGEFGLDAEAAGGEAGAYFLKVGLILGDLGADGIGAE